MAGAGKKVRESFEYLSESCGICAMSAGLPQNEAGLQDRSESFLHQFRLSSHRKAESQRMSGCAGMEECGEA